MINVNKQISILNDMNKLRINSEGYKDIELWMENFEDLDILNQYVSLEKVNIINCKITTIKSLSNLINLKILNLSENRIENILPLDCISLEEWDLSWNKIKKIKNLKDLKNLKKLDLSENLIENIKFEYELNNLEILNLSNNKIKKIKSKFIKLKKLSYLNISKNKIQSLDQVLSLKNIINLKVLLLNDIHYGENPICKIFNYQTLILYHFPHLDSLDNFQITNDSLVIAENEFKKKKIFYIMKIKTIERINSNLNNLIDLSFKVKLKKIKEDLKKYYSYYYTNPVYKSKFNEKLLFLNDMRFIIYNIKKFFKISFQLQKYFILKEMNFAGNFKLEEGNTNHKWYISCESLIKSRFKPTDERKKVNIKRVLRIHNTFLKNIFDENYDILSKEDSDNSLDYLFKGLDNNKENELYDIIENGFNDKVICLSNLLNFADKNRIKDLSNNHRNINIENNNKLDSILLPNGSILVCKVFIKKQLIDEKYNTIDNENHYELPINPDKEAVSIYREDFENPKHKVYFYYNKKIVLPEYLVYFDYTENSNQEFNIEIKNQNFIIDKKYLNIKNNKLLYFQKGTIQINNNIEYDEENLIFLKNIIEYIDSIYLNKSYLKLIEFLNNNFHFLVNDIIKILLFCLGSETEEILENKIYDINMNYSYIKIFSNLNNFSLNEGFSNIINIDLSFNKLIECPDLKSFINLNKFSIYFNLIEDIEEFNILLDNPKLRVLNIYGNPFKKYKILDYRKKILEKLDFLDKVDEIDKNYIFDKLLKYNLVQNQNYENNLSLIKKSENINDIKSINFNYNIKILNLSNNKIKSITLVQELIYLEELIVNNNKLESLENISKCKNLVKIEADNNLIKYISNGIILLKNLTFVSIINNKINSLEVISKIKNLEQIFLGSNKINSLKEVKKLNSWNFLIIWDLWANSICNDKDYRHYIIYNIQNLRVLDGIGVDEKELEKAKQKYFGKLTKEILFIRWNGIDIKKIKSLDLSNLGLNDQNPILNNKEFANLKEVILNNNLFTNLEIIGSMPKLLKLVAKNNQIKKLKFSNIKYDNLKYLDLSNNLLSSFYEINNINFPKLQILKLSSNFIRNPDNLNNLKELKDWDISLNKIKSFDKWNFYYYNKIKILNIDENNIKNIYKLPVLSNLQILHLKKNKINDTKDIFILNNYKNLVELNIKGNPITKRNEYIIEIAQNINHLLFIDSYKIERDHIENEVIQKHKNIENNSIGSIGKVNKVNLFELIPNFPNLIRKK